MMKYIYALMVCLGLMPLYAQQAFTDKLQAVVASEGRITLHQDKSITDLVNGSTKKPSTSSSRRGQIDSTSQYPDSTLVDSLSHGPKVRTNGYRIQVYFGDNSRRSKTEARAAGIRFRNYFPGHSVYVSFVSPHWRCHAGDFRTREEASEVLNQIRAMGIFREAVIVRSKVNVRM
ncbi:MAG: SPOR domain-containing protein [Bacteroidaceae bacterium]|nr:SPOR domain-containing protein [Bacteroidaceae bacterium]